LPEAAWQIVRSVPHLAHGDQLFSIRGAQGFGRWAEGKAALDRRLGDAMMEPWTLHDIRRSVATKMADMGIQPHIIEQILNHQSGHKSGVAGIYNRSSYEREVKTALATWADHVRVLAEGGERKVFPMQSATAS
jgi:integrase